MAQCRFIIPQKIMRRHYFNGQSMLHSQFETLIEPTAEEALIVSIEPEPYTIIDNIISMLNSSADSGIRDTDG